MPMAYKTVFNCLKRNPTWKTKSLLQQKMKLCTKESAPLYSNTVSHPAWLHSSSLVRRHLSLCTNIGWSHFCSLVYLLFECSFWLMTLGFSLDPSSHMISHSFLVKCYWAFSLGRVYSPNRHHPAQVGLIQPPGGATRAPAPMDGHPRQS